MKCGKSMRGAISYNEAKVRDGSAELILASKFGCDVSELSFSQKLHRFDILTQNCTRSAYNTVHLSLNFSPEDKLDAEQLQQIASDYMQRIGFGNQPYLVYRHSDTGHDHIHIVTTPVLPNGRTINLHNLVQRKSEPARKALEKEYHLTEAAGRKISEGLKPVPLEKVYYGKVPTKQAISQIVRDVVNSYRFNNLDELNIILRQFNIVADRGSLYSAKYQKGGLTYSVLNAQGDKIGVPVKASDIYTNPTLKMLEKKFSANTIKKAGLFKKVQQSVFSSVAASVNAQSFMAALQQKSIVCSMHPNAKGKSQELSFIDNRNKTVFTASEIGITPSELQKRWTGNYQQNTTAVTAPSTSEWTSLLNSEISQSSFAWSMLSKLMEHEYTEPDVSPELLKDKKRKKKKFR